jgi:RNA polymerase sigma-70 factor (ECF subfamily)
MTLSHGKSRRNFSRTRSQDWKARCADIKSGVATLANSKSRPLSASNDPNSDLSDASLLRRFRAGHQSAATQLYLRYAERLGNFATAKTGRDLVARVDPDSIVQSVFRSFFRRAQDGQYHVAPGEELWKLLLVMALNKIRSAATHHHAQRRDTRKTQSMADLEGSLRDEKWSDQTSFDILRMTIDEMLSTLTESQRAMVTLRIEGHEVDVIAEKTGRSKRSVERILQSFRQQLSHQLKDVAGEQAEESNE